MKGRAMSQRILAAIVFAAATLGTVQTSGAQATHSAVKENIAATPDGNEQEKPLMGDGIKVHGHWVITVRNPDGSLASHTEFENAIVTSGQALLTQFLARTHIPGYWTVGLGEEAQGPCLTNDGKPSACAIREANDALPTGNYAKAISNSLTLSVADQSTGNQPRFILTGMATAAMNYSVKSVTTLLWYCARTDAQPQSKCTTGGIAQGAQFSQATLSNPIAVSPGQAIQVVVTFTFS